MNNKQEEIILKSDGSAVLRTITEKQVSVVDDIINDLSTGVIMTARNVAKTDAGLPLHLVMHSAETYMGCFLPELTITSPWLVQGDILTMQVAGRDQKSDNPVMPLQWTTPPGMALLFLCRLLDSNTRTFPKDSCFLICYDEEKNGYYLPLPNIYENAALCMGDFNGLCTNARDAYQKAFNQLTNAQWNSDLLGGKEDRIQALFRFKSVKKSGKDVFVTLPVAGWKDHCIRCETPIVDMGRRLL